jgi:hypothetical protein
VPIRLLLLVSLFVQSSPSASFAQNSKICIVAVGEFKFSLPLDPAKHVSLHPVKPRSKATPSTEELAGYTSADTASDIATRFQSNVDSFRDWNKIDVSANASSRRSPSVIYREANGSTSLIEIGKRDFDIPEGNFQEGMRGHRPGRIEVIKKVRGPDGRWILKESESFASINKETGEIDTRGASCVKCHRLVGDGEIATLVRVSRVPNALDATRPRFGFAVRGPGTDRLQLRAVSLSPDEIQNLARHYNGQ